MIMKVTGEKKWRERMMEMADERKERIMEMTGEKKYIRKVNKGEGMKK